MARLWVFKPPNGGGSALATIYSHASGAVVEIPWSGDTNPSAGGWETSSGSASAGYSWTNFDAIITNQLGYGATKIVVVLAPISFGGSNTSTPNYVFTSGWGVANGVTQLYTGSDASYAGNGSIPLGTCAQGVDNTAFPVAWMDAFTIAWKAAINAALFHMAGAGYASKIAYIRVGGGAGGEWFPWATSALLTQVSPSTIAQLKTTWTNYMSAIETDIVAQASGFTFVQAVDAGFQAQGIPYNWADSEASIANGNSFGIGAEGLKAADITAYGFHGTVSGGINTAGYPSMDHAYLFATYPSAPKLQLQTSAASDPTGGAPVGSLVTLLPYAYGTVHATDIELYYQDWQVAFDSSNSNYASYHTNYQTAIASAEAFGPGSRSTHEALLVSAINAGRTRSTRESVVISLTRPASQPTVRSTREAILISLTSPIMGITYPISLPAISGLGPQDFTMIEQNVVGETESPMTFSQQEQAWKGQRFEAEINLPPLLMSESEQWIAALGSLFGKLGTFLMGDYTRPTPQGPMGGSPLVAGANASGLNQLAIRGATPSITNWGIAGDYIQVTATGGSQRIYKLLQNASTDISGNATLQIYPNIREALTDGLSIVTTNCQGTFRLQENTLKWKTDRNNMRAISFKAKEAM